MKLRNFLLFAVIFTASLASVSAQILFSANPTNYTQNFDSLGTASVTWANNSTLPGWYAQYKTNTTPTTITAGTGSSSTGSFYNFGTTSASDRAFGSISSGSTGNGAYGNTFGVRFTNDTAQTISGITISYNGEQWRNGGNTAAQSLYFYYLVSTTSLTNADAANSLAWVAFTNLNFTSPTVGATAAALDGNNTANRTAVSAALTGVTVPPGQEIFFRWVDLNDAGSDHGLAIDDLAITYTGVAPNLNPPSITTQPVSLTTYAGNTASFTVVADGKAPLAYQWYFTNAIQNVPVAGATASVLSLPTVTNENGGSYYVVVTNDLNAVTSSVVTLTVIPAVTTNIAYLHTLVDANYALTNTSTPFQIEGVVTTPVNLISSSSSFSFHVQDASGRGIDVFHATGFATDLPAQGAYVRIIAPLAQFNGLLELNPSPANPAHQLTVISNNAPLPAPYVLNLASAADPVVMSKIQGTYVIVSNVYLLYTNASFIQASANNLTISNALGQTLALLKPAGDADIASQAVPAFCTSVRGVISQADSSSPFTSSYQLVVTKYADMDTSVVVGAPSLDFQNAGGSLNFNWSDATYRLQATTNLLDTNSWVELTNGVSAFSETMVVPQRYYRLIKP